ncbi:MAG: Ribosomal RNA large subunit methyltransferase H [Candidatus Anoxychlamydiales bacterium]|nr:Ribosomal RNA large subunit methyltransferase H [Candidatus Anoxychlamydiales bacterium]
MFKVKIYTIHKTREKWLKLAIDEYEKRLTSVVKFEWIILKDEKDLEKKILNENFYICLDESGKSLSSIDFSKKIFDFFEKTKSIAFVIGSDIGLTKKIIENANFQLSLSKLTFTHQMVRVLLLEQIYRAYQISKNTKYHK